MDSSLGAKAPIMWRTLRYHTGEERFLHDRYHTLVLAARNRPSTPDIRGGEALQRIHRRYVRSRFWGYVPFYVMRGGVLEQTELRESNRDPDDVLRALTDSPPWHFAKSEEGRFAAALSELNFGLRPEIVVSPVGLAGGGEQRGYELLMPRTAALVPTNHATVRPLEGGDSPGLTLSTAVRKALRSWVCCCAVRLTLTDPDTVPAQRWLLDHGFRLSAVVPPKKTWLVSAGRRRDVDVLPTGVWTRPRDGLPVVGPYYRDFPARTEAEGAVLDYLRDHLTP
jgi:hypothetical protein